MKDSLFEKETRTRNYMRTALLVMFKAFDDVLGRDSVYKLTVEFTLGPHVFIRPSSDLKLSNKTFSDIWTRMHDYIDADLPIIKESIKVSDAYSKMVDEGIEEAASFLHFRRSSRITMSCIDDFKCYFYGSVMKHTGLLKAFDLMPYETGFFLLLPDIDEPDVIKEIDMPVKLFEAYSESYRIAHLLETDTITDVNKEICADNVTDLILTCESIFDAKLVKAAQGIVSKGKKFVFVAGPSSSGKTSTANRLCYAMRNYGIKPRLISLDDYYKDRTEAVKNGANIDWESIETIDVARFSSDMLDLLEGKEIELPRFDFRTQASLPSGKRISLGERDILIIEGIHGLNDVFAEQIPEDLIYRVYVSALSQLNISRHNRIPSTDIRLLRRIVRDHRSRGYDAANTLRRWPSVRNGEMENIFPFQENADIIINTTMVYELAAIKPYAERALFCVERGTPEYIKAKELLKFLDFVIPLSTDQIPPASIIREFIGGSCMNVG